MDTDKISTQDKKRKLRKLRSLLNTAQKVSNELAGEDMSTNHSDTLYKVRNEIHFCIERLQKITLN